MLATFKVKAKNMRFGERKWVEKTAIDIYRMAARRMNNGIIERFNADPKWEGQTFDEGSEYEKAYGELFMKVAEECSKKIGIRGKRIIKLIGGLDCLLLYPTRKKVNGEYIHQGIIKCKVEDYPT